MKTENLALALRVRKRRDGDDHEAGTADERSAVVRYLLSEAEAAERAGHRPEARALLKAANAILRNEHVEQAPTARPRGATS